MKKILVTRPFDNNAKNNTTKNSIESNITVKASKLIISKPKEISDKTVKM